MPTFKIEVFHLVSNVQMDKWLLLQKMANTALPCSSLAVIHKPMPCPLTVSMASVIRRNQKAIGFV